MTAEARLRTPSSLTLGLSNLGRNTTVGCVEECGAIDFAELALASGHTYVDTSNNYADGRSEAVLGAAANRLGPTRSADIITKVDVDPVTGRFDRDRVLRSFDESRARLGIDTVPLLHLHDPDMLSMSEALGPGGAVEGLLELRDSGAVGAIGVAGGPIPMMSAYVSSGMFDAVLCHNRFTLVDQSATALFEDARRRGMVVFNAAPFGAGLLAAGPRQGARYAYLPASAELLTWTRALELLCKEHGLSLPAVALAFSLQSPLIDSTVVGISSPQRLDELDDLQRQTVPSELWAKIEQLGPAPTPIIDPPTR